MAITSAGKTERLPRIREGAGERTLCVGSGTVGYPDSGKPTHHQVTVRWNEFANRHRTYNQA